MYVIVDACVCTTLPQVVVENESLQVELAVLAFGGVGQANRPQSTLGLPEDNNGVRVGLVAKVFRMAVVTLHLNCVFSY